MVLRRLAPLCLLLLAGCGGGGGSSSDGFSRISVAWPADVRSFTGSPIAGSALVRFVNVENSQQTEFPIVRPTTLKAVSKTYKLPDKIAAGTYSVTVLFCSGTTPIATNSVGFGSVTATVSGKGSVKGIDGEALGTIPFTSTIASIAVDADQIVRVNQRTSLGVTATTMGGGTVSLPVGVVSLTATGSALRANDDGTVTGLAAGTGTVVATAFGKTSPSATVTVQ